MPATAIFIPEDISLSPSGAIQLGEREGWHGTLSDIIEPEGEDIILARIAGVLVELPKDLSELLWDQMGQKIRVCNLSGHHWVGVMT